MTPEDAETLGLVVAAMDEAAAANRHEEWADLNTQFHLSISRLSAMPMLHEMTERVLARWDRVRRYYFSGVLVHRIEQAQREHRELYAAMKDRSLRVMEDTVKKHNQGALVAYTEYLHNHPVE
jgi:DNA-binding GntR family transcriptional regulator